MQLETVFIDRSRAPLTDSQVAPTSNPFAPSSLAPTDAFPGDAPQAPQAQLPPKPALQENPPNIELRSEALQVAAGQVLVLTELRKAMGCNPIWAGSPVCPADPARLSFDDQKLVYRLLDRPLSPTHTHSLHSQVQATGENFGVLRQTEVALQKTILALAKHRLELPTELNPSTPLYRNLLERLPQLQGDLQNCLKVELDALRGFLEEHDVRTVLYSLERASLLSTRESLSWRKTHRELASHRFTSDAATFSELDGVVILDALNQYHQVSANQNAESPISRECWGKLIKNIAGKLLVGKVNVEEEKKAFQQAFRELSKYEDETKIPSGVAMRMRSPRLEALMESLALYVELGIRSDLTISNAQMVAVTRMARRLAVQSQGMNRENSAEMLSSTIRQRQRPDSENLTPLEFYKARGQVSVSSHGVQPLLPDSGVPKLVGRNLVRVRQAMLYLGVDVCFEPVVAQHRSDNVLQILSRVGLAVQNGRNGINLDVQRFGVAS